MAITSLFNEYLPIRLKGLSDCGFQASYDIHQNSLIDNLNKIVTYPKTPNTTVYVTMPHTVTIAITIWWLDCFYILRYQKQLPFNCQSNGK